MLDRFRASETTTFFRVLHRASPGLATLWWALLLLRGTMPALLAVSTGVLVGAVRDGADLAAPLTFVSVVFVLVQVLAPVHQAVSAVLGAATAEWLNDQLMVGSVTPPGMGHLESNELAEDLSLARDFDLGMNGPPLFIAMDFIAGGLVLLVSGVLSAAVLFAFAWWAPLVLLGVWGATHRLLRESGVWKDRNTDEVRSAHRHAAYAYDLAVEPPAAKELRMFGLADWVIERFTQRRTRLYELQWEATRLRERPLAGALLVVLAGNALVFWAVADAVLDGRIGLGASTTYLQAAVGAAAVAFGGLSWALDTAAAPAAATLRLPSLMAATPERSSERPRAAQQVVGRPRGALPRRELRVRRRAGAAGPRPDRAGRHLDGGGRGQRRRQDHAGQAAVPALRPGGGRDRGRRRRPARPRPRRVPRRGDGCVPGLRPLRAAAARQRGTRRRDRRGGRPSSLAAAGATQLATLDTVLARGYDGGTDLSGGQWQRIALARALAAVRGGARLVLLDEPTAALDVRGEAEIFERILTETVDCTTILISHRFSTVRRADRICVVEHGRVVELGSHDELMARGGRYRTMFELQASRFTEVDELGEEVAHESLD